MSLWDEIDESRKKKPTWGTSPDRDGLRHFRRGLATPYKLVFTEFRTIEDRARQAIEEYLSIRASKVSDGLERRACGAVLGYLIFHSHDLERCTEYQMSQRFSMPRARLRRLLSRMEWDGVIDSVGIGMSTPYRVINLGRAMKEGYLDLDSEEAEKFMKLERRRVDSLPPRIRESLEPSLPDAKVFTEAEVLIGNLLAKPDQIVELIHIPFQPGHINYYAPGLWDFFTVCEFLDSRFYDSLVSQILMELDTPHRITAEDVETGLRRVGEKYLKLTRMRIKPVLNLLKKYGFKEGKTMIEKAYLKDKLLKQEKDSKGRGIPKHAVFKGDRPVQEGAVVPGHGYVSLQTEELTPTHIRLLANVYKAACSFAQYVGGDSELVKACGEEASQLESYVEPKLDEAQEEHEGQEESEAKTKNRSQSS